ncbi:MAG: hypothetical protein AB4062_15345 [Crocosphaera sp.]
MDNLKIYHDQQAKTLTIWFDDPQKEFLVDDYGLLIVISSILKNRDVL